MSDVYKVLVALNNSPSGFKAMDHAVDICHKMAGNVHTMIYVVYMVAKNPPQSLPYLDHLDRAFNKEIDQDAAKDIAACKEYLVSKYEHKINYSFIEVEGEGETGPLLEEYIRDAHPDVNLVVTGTRNFGSLKRWVLGSVSDHLLHCLECPVLVVKHTTPDPSEQIHSKQS